MCTWLPVVRIARHFPEDRSHTRALLSNATVSSVLPSLLRAAVSSPSEWPAASSEHSQQAGLRAPTGMLLILCTGMPIKESQWAATEHSLTAGTQLLVSN
jgi:hypothetical protein